MKKRVVLVGHCSPDSSYLSIAIRHVCPDAQIIRANDDAELQVQLEGGADLLLVNRVLDGSFANPSGIDLIARSHISHPRIASMLISNYPDAQDQARRHGALRGFGKTEIHAATTRQVLASAIGGPKL